MSVNNREWVVKVFVVAKLGVNCTLRKITFVLCRMFKIKFIVCRALNNGVAYIRIFNIDISVYIAVTLNKRFEINRVFNPVVNRLSGGCGKGCCRRFRFSIIIILCAEIYSAENDCEYYSGIYGFYLE